MTINKRVAEVMITFGLNKNQFAKRLGVHPTVVHNIIDEKGRGNKPSFDFILKLLSSFDTINGDWLLTGRGNMLFDQKETQEVAEPLVAYDKTVLEMIRDLSAENALLKKEIKDIAGEK